MTQTPLLMTSQVAARPRFDRASFIAPVSAGSVAMHVYTPWHASTDVLAGSEIATCSTTNRMSTGTNGVTDSKRVDPGHLEGGLT